MLCIMRTILQWAVEHNGYAWSESMLQRVGLKTFIIYMLMDFFKVKIIQKIKAKILLLVSVYRKQQNVL